MLTDFLLLAILIATENVRKNVIGFCIFRSSLGERCLG